MHINLFMVVLNFGVYVNNLVNIFFKKIYIYIYIYPKFLDIVNILLVYILLVYVQDAMYLLS